MPRVGWQPSCGTGGSFAVESVAAFVWNRWQACYGISGSFRVEQVAALPWNQWQDSPGIGGSFGVEYAPMTMRVSVQAMMDVFQLMDNNPLLGHYRVKMALDSLGYRYGHTTRLADGRPLQAGASAPAARAPRPEPGGTPQGDDGAASGLVCRSPVSGPDGRTLALECADF